VLEDKPEGNRVEGGAIKRHRRDGAERNRDAAPPREIDCLATRLDAFHGPAGGLHCGEELALAAAHVEESRVPRRPAEMTNVFIRPLPVTYEEWDDHTAEAGGRCERVAVVGVQIAVAKRATSPAPPARRRGLMHGGGVVVVVAIGDVSRA